MLVCLNPIHPLVNVVRLLDTVSRQSSAVAMMASVGQQDAVVILQKPLAITVHAEPIIGNAMQENYRVAVCFSRTHKPTAKSHTVRGREPYIPKFYGSPLGSS